MNLLNFDDIFHVIPKKFEFFDPTLQLFYSTYKLSRQVFLFFGAFHVLDELLTRFHVVPSSSSKNAATSSVTPYLLFRESRIPE